MKKIELGHGCVALVDDGDFEELNRYKWRVARPNGGGVYAIRNPWVSEGRGNTTISMHRQIMGEPKNLQIDHINNSGLDNRRENLRVCTSSQNLQNTRISRGKSKYKGVAWMAKRGRWVVMIRANGRKNFIGLYKDEILAAEGYDCAAVLAFGEFANLNFPLARAKYLCILERVVADNLEKGLLTL